MIPSNSDSTSPISPSRSTWPSPTTKLFVSSPVMSRSEHRRTASTICGPQSPGQQSDHVPADQLVARGLRLGLEQLAEPLERHLAALELGPRVVSGLVALSSADEAVG